MARRSTPNSKSKSTTAPADTSAETLPTEEEATSVAPAETSTTEATTTTPAVVAPTNPADAYRAAVVEALGEADASTGTLPAVNIDSLRRAMVAVTPSDRAALMLAVDGEVMTQAREARPMDIGAILTAATIRGAVENIATSKVRTLADPVADAAAASAALLMAAERVSRDVGHDDRERFDSLRDALVSEPSDTVTALAERLHAAANRKSASKGGGSGERVDVIGSLRAIVESADDGATFTVTELAKRVGAGTGSVSHAIDNLHASIAAAGGIAENVPNARGENVKGLRVSKSERAAA